MGSWWSTRFSATNGFASVGGAFRTRPTGAGLQSLTVATAGTTTFGAAVGGTTALSTLTASTGAVAMNGKGLRIRAGTARSYYLGLESSTLAVPGFRPPVKGLCVVPQGMEEGSEVELASNEFGLITGEPVEFRFFSSTVRAGDSVGSVVGNAERELEETSRLRVTLTRPRSEGEAESGGSEILPVKLQSTLTELGMLELWMKHTQSPLRWKVEFNIRQES